MCSVTSLTKMGWRPLKIGERNENIADFHFVRVYTQYIIKMNRDNN